MLLQVQREAVPTIFALAVLSALASADRQPLAATGHRADGDAGQKDGACKRRLRA